MFLFIIKESFKLISRARLSFLLSLVSTFLSVLLIVASFLLISLSERFQTDLKQSIKINLFLEDPISNDGIKKIEEQLNNEDFVNSLIYNDKEKAAENFIAETGEDFRKILDYNPLPASFTISLNEVYAQSDSIKMIVARLENISGVDEVVYQQQFIGKMLSRIDQYKKYIFIITGVLLFISLYIIYSTLQLIINSKYEELDTMKLVGAKISTIKLPIVLNGILIGFFAGAAALGIFLAISYYLDIYLGTKELINFKNPVYVAVIICTGPLLASIVSLISLRKINLKI